MCYSGQARDAFETSSKRVIQKIAEATRVLIGNQIADPVANSYDGRIAKFSRKLQQNNSETVTNENYKEIPKERYVYSEEKQEI